MNKINFFRGWFGGTVLCMLACSLQHCTRAPENKSQPVAARGSVVRASAVATQYVEKDGRRIAYRKIGQGPGYGFV